MLSRVAENLYWMARYVERAENTARLISVNTQLLLDLPKGIAPGWGPLVDIMGLNEAFEARFKEAGERQVLKFLMGDEKNYSSILSSLKLARENCRTVRDSLPREVWEIITELYLFAKERLSDGLTKRGRYEYLERIIQGSEQFIGVIDSTQSRDEAYDFLVIGRHIERADMTTRIIDVRSADLLPSEVGNFRPFDTIQWVSVLHSLSAYQMYRRHMQTRVRRADVLSFLFKDNRFPRAVRYCLDAMEESFGDLSNNTETLEQLRGMARQVDTTMVEELDQAALHEYIDELQLLVINLHQSIADSYFLNRQSASQQSTLNAA